jgi:hypothetical protein
MKENNSNNRIIQMLFSRLLYTNIIQLGQRDTEN